MVSKALEDHFNQGAPYNIEYRYLRADGEWRWFQSVGVVQRDETGRAVRMAENAANALEARYADDRPA